MRKIDLRWFFGCLRTVVTHRQLLLQLRKLTIPSLEASSVKLLPFTLLADIRNEDAHIENSSLHVGPGLGVVLEEEDPEEVMDVGTEDEIIRDTFIDDMVLGPTARVPPYPLSLPFPVQLR
jgi:hypothetical protein